MVRRFKLNAHTPLHPYSHTSFHVIPHRPSADTIKMDLNENHLWVSLVFGAIGAGMFLYGKKAGRMVPLGAGLGLMVVPYFIPNVILMAVASCAITALPWFVRES